MKSVFPILSTSLLTLLAYSNANATLLINEIDYDQVGSDTAKFIELFNPGLNDIHLNTYHLDLINGSALTPTLYHSFDLSGYSLAAGDYLVICNDAANVANCDYDAGISRNMIQNGRRDGIALYAGNSLLDAITYEGVISGFTEGSGGTIADNNAIPMSIGRIAPSRDSDDNALDFESGCLTPGMRNIPGSGDCSTVNSSALPLPSMGWLLISGLIGLRLSRKR